MQPSNTTQKIGGIGEQVGEMALTGGPLKAGAEALATKLPFLGKMAAPLLRVGAEAVNTGSNAALHGEPVGPSAATGAGGAALGESLPFVAPMLKKSAVGQYLKALSPTKAQNKVLAQRVVPGLIDRGVSGSLEGINETASAALEDVGPQISDAVKNIPQAKKLAIQPVLDSLESYKQEAVVNGVKVDPDLVNRATQLQRIVKQLGPDVSYSSLNRVRQIFDAKVARSGGYAGKTLSEGSMVDAMREGASAIRSELAKDSPDIAKLNKEYAFWSNVQQVVGDTIQRRSGQEGALMPKLAGIGGAATGHTPMGVAMYALGRVVQSPRWRTFSAVAKNRIANALAAGDAATVTKLIGRGASAYGAQQ
jgi:hypothetical protein